MASIETLLGYGKEFDILKLTDAELLENFKESFELEKRLMDEAAKAPPPRLKGGDDEEVEPSKPKAPKKPKQTKAEKNMDAMKKMLLEMAEVKKLLEEPSKPTQ